MPTVPKSVAEFLEGKRFAVAGVSRDRNQPANAIFRKLRDARYGVVPVNPNAGELEGSVCYPDVVSVPGSIDGVVIATHPDMAVAVVTQCADRGIERIWFHRSFGEGSVSNEALDLCRARGIEPIIGGCPLMFCEPVDLGHRCFRWWLQWRGSVPK